MAIDADVRALSQIALFQAFQPEQLRLLAFGTEHLKLTKGRELYREGDAADCGFLILTGTVHLVEDRNMSRRIVQSVGPGSLLGELALIAPVERQSGAVAATDCEVVRISRSLVRRVLDEYPELAARLHASLSARFAGLLDDMVKLERKFNS